MAKIPEIRTVSVTRYVTPLREGGSLPAIAEADDGFLYALKFFGAGQGVKALVADLIGGELARLAGLRVPEIVFANLDESFGRSEGDEEIQELLRKSEGLNLALHYLSGAISYDPTVDKIDALTASKIVWLDSLITNVDRTARNVNMLSWNKQLWLIDHGAALYFHHSWPDWEKAAVQPFAAIKDHVLLPLASELEAVTAVMKSSFTPEVIKSIIDLIPEVWLMDYAYSTDADTTRKIYVDFLTTRLNHSDLFIKEALHARASLI
jgi:hypothetical protein